MLARMDDGEPDDMRWITSDNGEHMLINNNGEVVAGAGGALNGKKYTNAKSTSKPVKQEVGKTKRYPKGKEKSGTASSASASATKYADLNSKDGTIKDSGMSKQEKADAYVKLLEEIEPGTTFKINNMEFRKGTNPNYPYEYIDYKGDKVNASDADSIAFAIKYNADKDNCLTFFDKDAEVQQRHEMVSQAEQSGNFSTSDELHGKREGKITESSDNFGAPGDYVVYRNGEIGKNGMIFFSPQKEGADTYSSLHDYGNTREYEVHLENPLVIEGETDVACIKKAYNALHPGKQLKANTEMTQSKWVSCDKQNATALNSGSSGYDGIVYIVDGVPSEVQVTAKKIKSDKVEKKAEYTTTDWSRNGRTYQEEILRSGKDPSEMEDYQRVE